MDISRVVLPALTRFTSSIASTANYGFTRVLSFTGSFNDRTSLLHDAELGPMQTEEEEHAAPPPPPKATDAAAPAAASVTTIAAGHVTFDIEAAAAATRLCPEGRPSSSGSGQEEADTETEDGDEAESRHVGKSVQTVCLFAASSSLVLFVNLSSNKPSAASGKNVALYSADMAFISLGFFSSLVLSMFSIVARPGDCEGAVARVQKWGMVVAVACVVVAFSLRMCIA